jgi:long-chain acyl-CoA synthetase
MAVLEAWWQGLQQGAIEFVVMPSGTLGRAELAHLVERFSARFAQARLAVGERVLILMTDELAAIAGHLAALFDGLVPVMVNADTPPERLAAIVLSTSPGLLMVAQARADEGWAAPIPTRLVFERQAVPRRWFFSPQASQAEQVARGFGLPATRQPPRLPADPTGLAYLLFTSGTTSSPKGVMVTLRQLGANVATLAEMLGIDRRSRLFNDMVLAHADGLVQGPILALASGATLIRAGGFSVSGLEDWLNTVRREGATHFTTVPTVWALIDRYAQHDDYFAAPGFQALSSVAAELHPALWARIEARFGHPVTNQYGLSETVASALYAGPHPRAGERFSVGVPVDCAARIVPAQPGDTVGELQLQGEQIFAGYWRNEEATAEVFTPDGWLRTGDLARQDAQGQYHIVGRLKRIIMSGGFLIRPEEVDEAMARHPAVLTAVTLAWPDELFGEVPVTAVELADPSVDDKALMAHARVHLEARKVPKRVCIVAALPRGDAGKPRLDQLRELISRQMAQGVDTSAVTATSASAPLPGSEADQALAATLITVAAGVFQVEPGDLTLASTPETVEAWDSFQHVALIVALESHFGVRLPTSRAASIRSLASALEAVRQANGQARVA